MDLKKAKSPDYRAMLGSDVARDDLVRNPTLQHKQIFADTWFFRAAYFEEQNAIDLAISYYQKAAVVAPQRTDINLALGRCFLRSLKLKRAMSYLSLVLLDEPNNAEANLYFGVILFNQGRANGAERFFKIALKGFPHRAAKRHQTVHYLVDCYLKQGAKQSAIELVETEQQAGALEPALLDRIAQFSDPVRVTPPAPQIEETQGERTWS